MYTKKIVNLTAAKSVSGSNLGLLQKIVVISLGESNISKDTAKTITKADLQTISATGALKSVLESYFSIVDSDITVFEMTAIAIDPETAAKKLERLKGYLADGTLSAYYLCMPKEFYEEPTITDLLTEYNNINKMTYFVFPVAFGTDLNTNSTLDKYKDMKSAILVYEQLESTNQSACGLFLGTYINNFNISLSNTMRSFEYIFINQNIKTITKTTADQLEKRAIVYFGNIIGKPGFLNIKTQDNESVDYYIAYDNMAIRVTDRLTNRLVNANNKFNSAVVYDDNGIKSLKLVIEDELDNCMNLKLISEYGAAYNESEQSIEQFNEIAYIPFQKYIASSPEDYKNNAYNGFTFECRVSRFILTVNINCNIY